MERPASVTVISALFFLVAAYLVAMGIIEFVAPGTLSMTMETGVTYGRELTGPQTALSVGAGWALIGSGLYRLRNWALVRDHPHGDRNCRVSAGGFRGRTGYYLAFFLLRLPDHGASRDRVVSGRVARGGGGFCAKVKPTVAGETASLRPGNGCHPERSEGPWCLLAAALPV